MEREYGNTMFLVILDGLVRAYWVLDLHTGPTITHQMGRVSAMGQYITLSD